MRVDEMRALSVADLTERRDHLKEQAMRLRFAIATNQETNHAQLRAVKREIARVNTILREREIVAAYEAALAESGSR